MSNNLRWTAEARYKVFCWVQKVDGLVQDYSISSAFAMELLQPCTKSPIWSQFPVCSYRVGCISMLWRNPSLSRYWIHNAVLDIVRRLYTHHAISSSWFHLLSGTNALGRKSAYLQIQPNNYNCFINEYSMAHRLSTHRTLFCWVVVRRRRILSISSNNGAENCKIMIDTMWENITHWYKYKYIFHMIFSILHYGH